VVWPQWTVVGGLAPRRLSLYVPFGSPVSAVRRGLGRHWAAGAARTQTIVHAAAGHPVAGRGRRTVAATNDGVMA